ncbi:MAG: IS30 family transposase [Candidatus Sungbacteria bacterium]|uniref:IS30 family transposase n=1 Tax=Candidatus Sungiibacteriota bacterium TaxID=2750080 RepID=A0A9D6LTM6_9BACT|nr:IS30 family transposase [Candidatus Sungbacteria bacterium]
MPYQHFSIEERENIQYGLWEKQSVRAIAYWLGRSPSSVSREINRNIPRTQRRYTPRLADARAEEHRHRCGRSERLKNDTIRSYVKTQIKGGYSPEQIAGRLPMAHPGQTISPEAIYQLPRYDLRHAGVPASSPEELF